MMIKIHKFRDSFYKMGLEKKQNFDMYKQDEYWMYHFLIKYRKVFAKLYEKYQYDAFSPENCFYNMVIHMHIKFYKIDIYFLFTLLTYNFFNTVYSQLLTRNLKYFLFKIYKNYDPEELNNFAGKYHSFPFLTEDEIKELYDCYFLKIRFQTPASRYKDKRKN